MQRQSWYSPEPVLIILESGSSDAIYTHISKGTLKAVAAQKKRKEREEEHYSLPEQEWPPHIKSQVEDFDLFCTTRTQWRKQSLRVPTLDKHRKAIQYVLGFLRYIQGIPLDQLDLTHLLDPFVINSYASWGRERKLASATIQTRISVASLIAQWHFHRSYPELDHTKAESVKAVREWIKAVPHHGDQPHASDAAFAEREISRDQCWEIVNFLAWRCKDLEKQKGVTAEVIDAWMDYLIIAILVTTAPRQREIRDLREKHLILKDNGVIVVRLSLEEHKTGSKTDKGREYPLFTGPMMKELTQDLRYYLQHIRPKNLNHDHLFFIRRGFTRNGHQSRRGDCIRDHTYLAIKVPQLIACVTAHRYGIENAKWTTPHDFRRILATWVCTYGSPEHLAIYAELMGHAIEMLVKIYNKMHPGKLASQAQLAYEQVAAQEHRVKTWTLSGNVEETITSITQMSTDSLISLLKKLVRKLWKALTSRKRASTFERLNQLEREILEDITELF